MASEDPAGSVRPLVVAGATVLRERAVEVPEERWATPEIRELVADMRATVRAAPGVGLAAPQVGIGARVAVVEDPPELQANVLPPLLEIQERRPLPFQALVNPRLTVVDPTPLTFFEGCLSVPGYRALVTRARAVRVEAVDEEGRPVVLDVTGWPARILQHELDHLDGALYVDRMEPRSLVSEERYQKWWAFRSLDDVRRELGIDGP